eukprot:INCI16549.2.p2 GENE.INCI16549.2~~INCI16549.2.p2  ORF type:complete len:215 (+),score=45.48 INCI16549.2:155-799(+)
MADLRGQHDRKKQKTKKKKSKQRENRGMPQQAASTQAGVKRKHSSTKLQGLVPVVPQSSVHARRARAIEERASARAARNEASERERARLEDAAAAVALDFDALDGLSWMPKVAARGTSSEQRQKYTLSTDDATMDFKPRPPKLGIGAKAASASSSAAEDTGLRKVLRKEMTKTKRLQKQAAVNEGSSSDGSDQGSGSDDEDVSRTRLAHRHRGR